MNAPAGIKPGAQPGAPPAAPRRPARLPADREFLPAALEILETPPSPARIYLLLLICSFVVVAVAWAFFGRIDIIAIAQGKIQSTGRVKLVQPVETGKVRAVLAQNGKRVSEGEVLVELDDRDLRAEETALTTGLAALKGEMRRRSASLALARARSFDAPKMDWPADIPASVRAREENVLRGDIAQLQAGVESFAAQRRQKDAERQRLVDTIASQRQLLTIQQQRVDMRTTLEKTKAGSLASLIDARETIQQQRITLAQQTGQLAETIAAAETLERDTTKLFETFTAENGQKLADAEKQADETGQRLVKAQIRAANMTLRAPASGTVQSSTITTIGQVVMPGEEVMRVVPDDSGFEIECYLPNKDIGFVAAGQDAIVKIESFPFTRYGSLTAKVTRVSQEAIPEPEAQQIEASAGKSTSRNTVLGGAQRVQNLVFPLTLKADQTSINVDGTAIPISNGMAVAVEIKTGERRIIDYIFSPLVEVSSRALKER